jgi:hypothetical protein
MTDQFDTDRRALLQKSLLTGGALLGAALAGGTRDAEAAITAAPLPDMVRRVVSSNNAEGKSYVSKDEMVKRDQIWSTKDGEIFGPVTGSDTAKPQPPIVSKNLPDGGTQAYFFSIGPSKDKLDRATIKGWHRDESIVYIYFVSGEVTWLTETDQVVLKAGDILIQRNANHTWHNSGTIPATAFSVKIRV